MDGVPGSPHPQGSKPGANPTFLYERDKTARIYAHPPNNPGGLFMDPGRPDVGNSPRLEKNVSPPAPGEPEHVRSVLLTNSFSLPLTHTFFTAVFRQFRDETDLQGSRGCQQSTPDVFSVCPAVFVRYFGLRLRLAGNGIEQPLRMGAIKAPRAGGESGCSRRKNLRFRRDVWP